LLVDRKPSAQHDRARQRTPRPTFRAGRVSDADPVGNSYLEVVTKIFDMFELLSIALQVMRAARVV
jgi:hypothetical protein